MRWSYFFKLWFSTVVLGTTTLMLLLNSDFTLYLNRSSVVLYLVVLLSITAISFPTFTLLAFIFNYLDGFEIKIMKVKIILISIIVIGIITTQLIMVKELTFLVSVSFSISAIISGMLFKLKRTVDQEDPLDQSKVPQNED